MITIALLGLAQPNTSLQQADHFIRQHRSELGLRQSQQQLIPIKQQVDQLKMRHIRYQQIYHGVPVFGAQLFVHLNQDNDVAISTGRIVPAMNVSTQPTLTVNQAIVQAKQYWREQYNDDVFAGVITQGQTLYIFDKRFILNQPNQTAHLVWEIILNQTQPRRRERYYIDAHSGALVYQFSDIHTAINRRVYDCSQGTCFLNTMISDYTYGRSEGQSERGANPTYGGTDVDDLYSMVNTTHNYYLATFGRDGANNQGGLGDEVYTDVYSYIDGVSQQDCPNAYFDGHSIYFCYGVVSDDIVAHEYTHAVSNFALSGGFVYTNESGALDEAFSDIFGEAIEYYALGNNDWLMGTEVNAPGLTEPLRSLSDPTSIYDSTTGTVYPDRFMSSTYYCGNDDNGGVHHNSTVFSHAAYLVAMGGSFNHCTITGLGRAKQEQIFYRALTSYLTASATFNQAYTALITACGDLYSATDCKEVKKALKAVELDQAGYCSGQRAVDPGCSTVDAATYVTSVTSNHASGYFKAGAVIDIIVTFSKAVTSNGDVTVNFETGAIDHSCNFTMNNSTTGSCNYIVQTSDNTAAFTVNSISGIVVDQDGYTVSNFIPVTNLTTTKTIVLDNTAPALSDLSMISAKRVVGMNQAVSFNLEFNETVSSLGDLTLSFNTGNQIANCNLTISASTTGSCNYLVKKNDHISSLTVNTITGTVTDLAGNSTTSFTVPASLTSDPVVRLDGIKPRGSVKINFNATVTRSPEVMLQLTSIDTGSRVKKMRLSNDGKHWTKWKKFRKQFSSWDITAAQYGGMHYIGTKSVYVQFKDTANNRSKKKLDRIVYQP